MISASLLIVPTIAAALVWIINSDRARRFLLVLTAAINLLLSGASCLIEPGELFRGWIAPDEISKLFFCITGIVFLAASVQTVKYLHREAEKRKHSPKKAYEDDEMSERGFISCLLIFLSTMNLVICASHTGLMWVAIEATTLASAPLIYFHKNNHSLEATWKYILICSVGIGLALLGNLMLYEAMQLNGIGTQMLIQDIIKNAGALNKGWLEASFILFLVGYGTKMGLAPMHTWLPDAYSESPSTVSALMSGALFNCSFLGLLRIHQICVSAGVGDFSQELLKIAGLLSMGIAAVFIIGQTDYKRMLAYSSVEHIGIMAFGIGTGGIAVYGSLLHTLNHSIVKTALFLTAGNILAAYGTRHISDVKAMVKEVPATGVLWMAGLLAICGFPPFGTFITELTIAKGAIESGNYLSAGLYIGFLALIFAGISKIMISMAMGSGCLVPEKQKSQLILPAAVLLVFSVVLGLYIPDWLSEAVGQISLKFGAQ